MPEPIRCPEKGALEIEHDGKQFGTYVCTAPATHTLEMVLAPEYFGRLQSRGPQDRLLRVGDMIDVRPEDCSWYVRLMVRACLPSVDKVIMAAIVPAVQFDVGELPDGWAMEFKGTDGLLSWPGESRLVPHPGRGQRPHCRARWRSDGSSQRQAGPEAQGCC